jgi:xanthine dehydrogenase/oxidase
MEGTYVLETCIEHVAHALGLPSGAVRDRNLYTKGDVTPFGQPLSYCNARLVYDKVKETSGYEERATAVHEFNAANR